MSPLFLPISSQWGQHTVRQKEEKEKEKHKSHIRQSSELTELGHLASCSSHARIKKRNKNVGRPLNWRDREPQQGHN